MNFSDHRDDFIGWLFIVTLSDHLNDNPDFIKDSQNIDVKLIVNGKEFSFETVGKRLEESLNSMVEKKAAELLLQKFNGLRDLLDKVELLAKMEIEKTFPNINIAEL
jgi:hypothetical protein